MFFEPIFVIIFLIKCGLVAAHVRATKQLSVVSWPFFSASLDVFVDFSRCGTVYMKRIKKILSALSGAEGFPDLVYFSKMDYKSRHADSNRGPAVYETAALPLSHVGNFYSLRREDYTQHCAACQEAPEHQNWMPKDRMQAGILLHVWDSCMDYLYEL